MHPARLRAAWWALRALRRTRRVLPEAGLETAGSLPRPPMLPAHAARGVMAVLRRRQDTCLERALVLQAWHAAQGHPRDLVIGISASRSGFKAHAWVDGERPPADETFTELHRRPAE